MKLNLSARPLMVAVLSSAAVLASASHAQAGLFDFLFGGAPQRAAPQYQPSYSRPPLDVRVNPSKRGKGAPGVAKVRPGKERGTKMVNKSIDPRKHPNWFLEDPTLRRGDVVVLPTGVMVYQGGSRPQTREDFAKLGDSRLVSKKEADRIKAMVGPPTVTAESDAAVRNKEAAGASNPVQ